MAALIISDRIYYILRRLRTWANQQMIIYLFTAACVCNIIYYIVLQKGGWYKERMVTARKEDAIDRTSQRIGICTQDVLTGE